MDKKRIRPPRKIGERAHETTTVGVRVDTRDAFDKLATHWGTTRTEVMRYLADVAMAGYIGVPAPDASVVIDYSLDKAPESIEERAVALVDAIFAGQATENEARAQVVTLVRLAGCEARAAWAKGDGDAD